LRSLPRDRRASFTDVNIDFLPKVAAALASCRRGAAPSSDAYLLPIDFCSWGRGCRTVAAASSKANLLDITLPILIARSLATRRRRPWLLPTPDLDVNFLILPLTRGRPSGASPLTFPNDNLFFTVDLVEVTRVWRPSLAITFPNNDLLLLQPLRGCP